LAAVHWKRLAGLALMLAAPLARGVATFSLVTWNTAGNGVADWSTNSPQIQAMGRILAYLDPDVVALQEIPFTNSWRMPEFVRTYLPGFYLSTNSGGDGYVRSVFLSRYPITRSQSWLNRTNLAAFGYDGPFTRDLFEAQVAVPGFALPLHAFTTHAKAGTTATDARRRVAEAAAVSNFLVNSFSPTNYAPYFLAGDLNEDPSRPADTNQQSLPILLSAPTGLLPTLPVNPVTGSGLTIASGSLFARYDHILPCALLFSNISASQVFRTGVLDPLPGDLRSGDDQAASDHLPLCMVFNNPYEQPFRLTAVGVQGRQLRIQWESVPGQAYRVDVSSNLTGWTELVTRLIATSRVSLISIGLGEAPDFFRVGRLP